jgi:hypothetical protein
MHHMNEALTAWRQHLELKQLLADIRLDLLRLEFARKAGFNRQQPRDALGRWTDEAIDLSSAGKPKIPNVKNFPSWAAQKFISLYCLGSIKEKFPGEFLDAKVAEIQEQAKRGNRRARTCLKLLGSRDYRK